MSSSGTDKSGFAGQASPNSGATPFNAISFLIAQQIGLLSTAKLVQVQACTNSGGLSPVGTVDVLPLVNMLDGQGNATPHGTVYKFPYFRLQGGKNAIVMDPQKGDIGLAIFSDRDISVVKRAKKQSNPGSYRRFDIADGLYLGGFLNDTPTQYLRFKIDGDGNPVGFDLVDTFGNSIVTSTDGILITDKFGHTFNMKSDGIAITGDVTVTGKFTTTDTTSLGGGAQAVKLADGSNATKVKAT